MKSVGHGKQRCQHNGTWIPRCLTRPTHRPRASKAPAQSAKRIGTWWLSCLVATRCANCANQRGFASALCAVRTWQPGLSSWNEMPIEDGTRFRCSGLNRKSSQMLFPLGGFFVMLHAVEILSQGFESFLTGRLVDSLGFWFSH